jgi:hypothetical protein
MGEMTNAHRNSKELKETGCEDVEWIHLAQAEVRRQVLVNTVINVDELQGAESLFRS